MIGRIDPPARCHGTAAGWSTGLIGVLWACLPVFSWAGSGDPRSSFLHCLAFTFGLLFACLGSPVFLGAGCVVGFHPVPTGLDFSFLCIALSVG